MEKSNWFAPKRFGYGAGLPIAWQGWALLAEFVVLLVTDMLFVTPRWLAIGIAIVLIAGVSSLAAQHTRGGWHWRWGRE